MISVQERIKAEKLDVPNSPSKIKMSSKVKTVQKKKVGMSKGEKDLYQSVKMIRTERVEYERTMKIQEETYRRMRESQFYNGENGDVAPPTATAVLENRSRYG